MLPIYIAVAYYLIFTKVIPGLYQKWKIHKMLQSRRRVVLFTRYPAPGKTKTRLMSSLGSFGAAALQLLMTNHLLDVLKNSHKKLSQLCIEVRYHGSTAPQMEHWLGHRVLVCRPQVGSDLGSRMTNAITEALNEGAKTVIIVGSDIPGISVEVIEEAFQLLEEQETDVILGPAVDGGYYTVGASYKTKDKISQFFEGIDWGTDKVLQQQVEAGEKLGIKLKLLSTKLNDVDTEDDLPVVERYFGITKNDILKPHWSIIIPILNEARNLDKTIRTLIENADSPERLEIIIADGQSEDKPEEVIHSLQKEFKSTGVDIKIITCTKRGRGDQLNEGAAASRHKLMMFLHADSQLPSHYDTMAWHTLVKPGIAAGAFQFGLDVVHTEEKRKQISWWFLQQMRLLEWGTRKRSLKMELPYGDQGLFLWRTTFDKVGGYPPYRLMEDYEIITKLKKEGRIGHVTGPPLLTSARRWQKHGYMKITGINTFIITAYKCGVHPNTLARWYYGQ